MATRPPRVTSTRRQPTTRGGPVVTSRTRQPTTGQGRIVRQPANPWVSRGTLAGMHGTLPGGAVAGVPSASPAAPVGPQYSLSNLPVDASYDQAIGLLQRQRDEGFAALTQQRTSGLSDYGFNEGPGGQLLYDPNNPFSKASELKKAHDTSRRSTAQTMGAGGQLYAGSFQNAQDLINRNQLQSEDALQKLVGGFLARNTQARAKAGTDYEIAAGQAYGDRVGRFQSNPNYDPATLEASAAQSAASAAARAPSAGTPAARSNAAAGLRRRARLTGARIGRI